MNNRRKSDQAPGLGRRLTQTTIITAGAALLVASLALIAVQFVSLRAAMVDDLRVQARIIGTNSSAALMFGDERAGVETLAGLAASPPVVAASIFDARGATLAHYERAGRITLQAPSAAQADSAYDVGARYIDVSEPVRVNNQHIGTIAIRASLDGLFARLLAYAVLTLAVALCSLALAWALVASMRRRVRKAEEHLHFLAHVDSVTTLPNRHEFNERLALALSEADRINATVGLLLLDLDNFKVVNDTLGHDCGDMLLKQVADRLLASLRQTDIICRIGGDEFVIIVEPAGDQGETEAVARKILAVLAAPFAVNGHQLYVSASIGVSIYPRDAGDARTLTRSADTAMYHAKNNGKNAFEVFQPAMEEKAQKRLKLEANLRRALEHDELELHYQPQIDLRSGRLVGVEVLARWHCAELGHVSPAEFIPVAEESGIIVPLGRWVLQHACRQAAAWRDAGLLDTIEHVAVNLSARQTRDDGLMHDIQAILRETGLPPRLLELEITEGVLMENVNANLDLLHGFQAAGIHLSIDDFGTGYSSMSYLKRFPIDQLKIDRSFVHDVPGDGEAIATAIIAMAHSLGMTVVAEGVETLEQLEFLRRAGCDIMQGYYFARPMPAAQLTDLLRTHGGNWQPSAQALLL
ncbi:bifunctional diguanylate cyclase/phosphodiesterase [Massilia sp. CF038]|uniref:putative bifunctional diguanylate cyclase/phosphodiesterase n=1 Tax=Massilia sp. CF038 TaxID=1881045 RepID=UPI00091C7478|nr:EAL domain-containing protein [Massilia sp. CF038]SHG69387.1 diguanylate cyclase/phosphodiesterase [Massilia sp. CF038]